MLDVGALAGHPELVGDLGLGAALGEQLGRLQPSGFTGGTLCGRVRAAGGRHRRTLTHPQPQPSTQPTKLKIDVVSFHWTALA
jgi:hypothetical protein